MNNTSSPPKKVTFTDAKAGDRVWSLTEGWGTVRNRYAPHTTYPLNVEFENGSIRTYTLWGLPLFTDLNPTLFWDEVKIEAPEKPLPHLEVDTKVLVWVRPELKFKRHFSHFKNGLIVTFECGRTSFTALDEYSLTPWPHWELAE